MEETVEKTISLYSGLGLRSLFAKIRFWDAPYQEVEKLVPKEGFMVDLGCGEGTFMNFLALGSSKRKVLGIEIDKKRLEIANRGLSNVSFKHGDATNISFPPADVIILFHLLHHLNSYKEQGKVLKKCFNQLKINGKLIIVEAVPKTSFKFLITWFTDHFLVPWIFERRLYSSIFFRTKRGWVNILRGKGFSCKAIGAEKGKPFTHIIFICQKK